MALSYNARGFLLLLAAASLLAASEARTLVVGGSEGWRYGFNYTDWAFQNSPFYIKDQLGKHPRVLFLNLYKRNDIRRKRIRT